MIEYAKNAKNRGIEVIIATASGAAHLPGMIGAFTILPDFVFFPISCYVAQDKKRQQ
jgi:phosphoribosylcarboxyaminoimidazole (NCAIR) mutase